MLIISQPFIQKVGMQKQWVSFFFSKEQVFLFSLPNFVFFWPNIPTLGQVGSFSELGSFSTAPGRQSSEGALSTRSALKDLNHNWPQASQPGVEPPPVVRGAPIPVFLAPQTVDGRALAAKMRDVCGRDRNGSCLMPMLAVHPRIHSGTLSLPSRASHTVKKEFSCFLSVKSGFPGLLVSADPRKLRAVAQKLRRVRCHMFFGALPGEFSHVFRRSSRRIFIFACIFKVHKS